MENPLSKEQDQSKVIKVSFGSQLGPALLMGSFAVLLLKCAPHYWPIGLTAFLGYLTTQYLKKRGLFLSLFILAAVLLLLLRTGAELFWPLLLAGSISVSWALIFLGGQEASSIQSQKDEKILALAKQSQELEKQLREAKIAISKESKDLILEKERLNAQLSVSLTQCNQLQSTLQIAEREREKLNYTSSTRVSFTDSCSGEDASCTIGSTKADPRSPRRSRT